MSDAIKTMNLSVYVQENGIIRLQSTGLLIGRLSGIEFEQLQAEITASRKANAKKWHKTWREKKMKEDPEKVRAARRAAYARNKLKAMREAKVKRDERQGKATD